MLPGCTSGCGAKRLHIAGGARGLSMPAPQGPKNANMACRFSQRSESKNPCHEYRQPKIASWKKPEQRKSIGSVGGRTCRSGNGVRCVKITAPTERRGSFFRTITRALARIVGVRTELEELATGTR